MKHTLAFTLMLLACFTMYATQPEQRYVSHSSYDWEPLAANVCKGRTTPYEKYYAIYRWLAENIDYDTTYSIYDADEAIKQRKGVCSAYSRLFYHLAKAQGLKTEIVRGYSKRPDGTISQKGHAWIFAYTDTVTDRGILIDPTWGAGYVDCNGFTREVKDEWFDVVPELMILTHIPREEYGDYQRIADKVTREEFERLPYYRPYLAVYGVDAAEFLASLRSGKDIRLPKFFYNSSVKKASVPLRSAIYMGECCRIEIETDMPAEYFSVSGGNGSFHKKGNVVYCNIKVGTSDNLYISAKRPDNPDGSYFVLVQYKVSQLPKPLRFRA